MNKKIYVRTEIEIPGNPTAIHIAEMQEQSQKDPTSIPMCTMLRIIELSGSRDGEVVTGAGEIPNRAVGLAAQPNSEVPHPDTYEEFPDINATHISVDTFEGLWLEAITKFPELA